MTSASMRLRVLLPARVLVDDAARRIVARAVERARDMAERAYPLLLRESLRDIDVPSANVE